MNVEFYSYAVYTAVLGMLVVFLSLSALSVMMVVLKRIFSGEGDGAALQGSAKRQTGGAKTPKSPDPSEGMPVWVPIAVAAFLTEEQEPDKPTADPWNSVINQYDPWIAGGRPNKRGQAG